MVRHIHDRIVYGSFRVANKRFTTVQSVNSNAYPQQGVQDARQWFWGGESRFYNYVEALTKGVEQHDGFDEIVVAQAGGRR